MSYSLREGNVRSLWHVSYPLILSFFSGLAMIAVDRFYLAHYSPAALGAAVSGGMMAWAYTFSGQTITNIAGVFVAQYNGAKRYKSIAEPVWQMIWFSLALSLPFAAAGIWFGPYIFSGSAIKAEQLLYFRWILAISPFMCMQGALNGFFIGRGRTAVITWLSLLGNIVNLALDPLFIFGWGPIPEWGMAGACLATGIGVLIQIAIMFYIFMKKENREAYGSGNASLSIGTMWDCIRIGSPEAVACWLELNAWGLFYNLMAGLSEIHLLVTAVTQSVLMAFFWFACGLEHGSSTLCGNLIGAGLKEEIPRLFRSGLKIIAGFAVILSLVLWVGGDTIVGLFLKNTHNLEGAENFKLITAEQMGMAKVILEESIAVVGVYIIIETVRLMLYGLLRGAGDTVFILWLSVLGTWSMLMVPTYLFMTLWKYPIRFGFVIWIFYATVMAALCVWRFKQGAWKHKQILSPKEDELTERVQMQNLEEV